MVNLAALLVIGFDGFLRTGELFSLRKFSVAQSAKRTVLTLHNTKTGRRKGVDEHVTIRSTIGQTLLRKSMETLQPPERILDTTPGAARTNLKRLLYFFGLEDDNYNFYSLRRGGATTYYFNSGSMDETLVLGRWEHATTARMYIEQSAAHLAEIRMTSAQTNALKAYAGCLRGLKG